MTARRGNHPQTDKWGFGYHVWGVPECLWLYKSRDCVMLKRSLSLLVPFWGKYVCLKSYVGVSNWQGEAKFDCLLSASLHWELHFLDFPLLCGFKLELVKVVVVWVWEGIGKVTSFYSEHCWLGAKIPEDSSFSLLLPSLQSSLLCWVPALLIHSDLRPPSHT